MDRRGFTLVELLVVVAVLGVLAAILLPVFGRAKEEGKVASDITKLHQLAVANSLYQQTWGEGVGSCADLVVTGHVPKEVCSSSRDFVPEGFVNLWSTQNPYWDDPGIRISFMGRQESLGAPGKFNDYQKGKWEAMVRHCDDIALFVDLLDLPQWCTHNYSGPSCIYHGPRMLSYLEGMRVGSLVRRVFDDGSVRVGRLHEIWIMRDGVRSWGGEFVDDAPWGEDCDWQSIADESPQP